MTAALLFTFQAAFQVAFAQNIYSKGDSTAIYKLLEKADEVTDVNVDSAMFYARSALKMSKQKGMKRGEGWALLKIGDLKKYINSKDSVEVLNLAGLKIASQLKDDFMQALGHFQLGQFYMFESRFKESEDNYKKSLQVKFEKDQSDYTSMVYSDLGMLRNRQGKFEEQVEWLLKAKRLGDKLNDPSIAAMALSNLAIANNTLGNNREAVENLRESISLRLKIGNLIGLANNYNSLARMLQKDSLAAAIRYQKLGMYYAEQTKVKAWIATSHSTLSNLLTQQGKTAEAFEHEKKGIQLFMEAGDLNQVAYRSIGAGKLAAMLGNDKHALRFFQNAEDISTRIKARANLRDVFLTRSFFYRDRKDFPKAYQNLTQYTAYKDSLMRETTQSNIAELQLKYETEKKDREIALLNTERKVRLLETEKQLKNQRLMRNGIIGATCFLLLITGILFNRYQLKKRLEQQQAIINFRNDVARDLHDDIGSTLTSIKILSEVSHSNLVKDQVKAGSYLKKITEQSTHMQQEMSDIVWAIKPDNDKLANMLVRMREFVSHTLEPKNIRAEFVIDELVLSSSLDMQQRRDFFLIFKEAINNAAKYSDATTVKILLQKLNENIMLTISDNGTGFEMETETSSNGLKNMRSRAAGLAGTCEITSANGSGTTIELKIPAG
ncbi:tetratricopeptide repeat-containing sensor histidine kinase [Dyadobacter arcticus]|uniref:Signal transduction histidine kinase n=1 Tax=Dyadobacter arcticus TaxID=1078754 RepID=A0ABX0UJD0_9BACT|nr:tetratricopeptide repeat-containing sensor histidine kinase [Dyadobacter arcticus]NIJ53022.1 signal transduction histidine kinase [Dyadobacter arcticus]